MPVPLRNRLIDLGAETLAEALLGLAEQSDAAEALLFRLTATPEEGTKRIKAKLAGLKRSRSFVDWRGIPALRLKLNSLLQDLEATVCQPKQGLELMKLFFETDCSTFHRCDDSSGHIGDIFRFDAQVLFVQYARECQDKIWVRKLVQKLLGQDEYGVRYPIIEKAHDFLPAAEIRTLMEDCQRCADGTSEDSDKGHWMILVQSLARQIQDAPRFEQARLHSCDHSPEPAAGVCIEIGTVYLECGNPRQSLVWLKRAGGGREYEASKRDALLIQVYGQLGETDKQRETAWRLFRAGRSTESLETLLAVVGVHQRETILAEEARAILSQPQLRVGELTFLVDTKQYDAAEQHLLNFADETQGRFYGHLLPCAEALEAEGKLLGATVIYRALLDAILESARPKTYSHGARYLKKLKLLSKLIPAWRGLCNHEDYLLHVRKKHGLKYSFWKRME